MANDNAAIAIDILKRHALRKTAFRIEVISIFLDQADIALSNNEIEAKLPNADRVTLYRTLKSFEQKGIIHQALDGSGTNKYAMCHSNCSEHHHEDNHAHFHCTSCGKTQCLEEINTPDVRLPEGFVSKVSYMIIQGNCNICHEAN